MNKQEQFDKLMNIFTDSEIRERSYYPRFRLEWEKLLKSAFENDREYFPADAPTVCTVEHSFLGADVSFHFDRRKMADWYAQELGKRKHIVFQPKRLKRRDGKLFFHDIPCLYDPKADESSLSEEERNIIAVALPQLPPKLQIVYGNRWVEGRFNALLKTRLSIFLADTDYVPAFLASDSEICSYLFLMDCCIIKENFSKVKDEQLEQYLHIFKGSPMLRIKGLLD